MGILCIFKGVYFYYYQTLYLRKVKRPITLNIIITTETEKTNHKSIFKILGNLNSPPSFFSSSKAAICYFKTFIFLWYNLKSIKNNALG